MLHFLHVFFFVFIIAQCGKSKKSNLAGKSASSAAANSAKQTSNVSQPVATGPTQPLSGAVESSAPPSAPGPDIGQEVQAKSPTQAPTPTPAPIGDQKQSENEVKKAKDKTVQEVDPEETERQKKILAAIEEKIKKDEAAGVPYLEVSEKQIEKERLEKQKNPTKSAKDEVYHV